MVALDAETPDGWDYYDIDSIMADEVTVPCTLSHGCTGVGQIIDPSSDSSSLYPGSEVELPLWMVPVMARRHLVQVSLPNIYGDRMRRKIKAGAGCEDLRVRCKYFYTAAARVHAAMAATGAADDSFPQFIVSTFAARYRELLTRAPVLESASEYTAIQSKLTQEELKLFAAATGAVYAHEQWRANKDTCEAARDRNMLAVRGTKRRRQPSGQENEAPA